MPRVLADSFTMCQTAFSVIPSPHAKTETEAIEHALDFAIAVPEQNRLVLFIDKSPAGPFRSSVASGRRPKAAHKNDAREIRARSERQQHGILRLCKKGPGA
jgi:hypothetical protein